MGSIFAWILSYVGDFFTVIISVVLYPFDYVMAHYLVVNPTLPDFVLNVWRCLLYVVDFVLPYSVFINCIKAVVAVRMMLICFGVLWWCFQHLMHGVSSALGFLGKFFGG